MAKKKSVRKPGAAKKTAKKAVRKASVKKPAPAKPAPLKKVAAKKSAAKQPAAKRLASKMAAPKPSAASQAKPANAAGPAWPREGSKAPDFTAVAHDGSQVKLSALKGRPVVLYFYPKDDTPGCTVEACGFRDAHAQFGKRKAVVLGVSPDSPRSHVKFREKFKLPFTLLADENHAVAERYGAWREKSMYGKTYMGVARSTFVIDAAGTIAKAFTTVKPEGHEHEVLAALAALR